MGSKGQIFYIKQYRGFFCGLQKNCKRFTVRYIFVIYNTLPILKTQLAILLTTAYYIVACCNIVKIHTENNVMVVICLAFNYDGIINRKS